MVSLGTWAPQSGFRGALAAPQRECPCTQGEGQAGPRLTAQHVESAGDQGAILGAKLYRFG